MTKGTGIKICETPEELAGYFASLLVSKTREIPGDRLFSWVLSGGATPKVIFRFLAANCRDSVDWRRVNVFWGDERCVGPEDADSNYKMARENLLDHVPLPSSNIFRIKGETDPATESGRYAELFRKYVPVYYDNPRADLMMLGLGEDGHTVSIFPANTGLFGSEELFVQAEHPGTRQQRITATGKVINHAKVVVFIATGKAKASMVSRVIDRTEGWDRLPASLVKPENGELIWLLDRESAINIRPLQGR